MRKKGIDAKEIAEKWANRETVVTRLFFTVVAAFIIGGSIYGFLIYPHIKFAENISKIAFQYEVNDEVLDMYTSVISSDCFEKETAVKRDEIVYLDGEKGENVLNSQGKITKWGLFGAIVKVKKKDGEIKKVAIFFEIRPSSQPKETIKLKYSGKENEYYALLE